MAEDILSRIDAKHIAAAIKRLPAPSKSPDTVRRFNYVVPGFGLVRFEFTRTVTMNGKFRQYAWTPSSAHAVTMTFE